MPVTLTNPSQLLARHQERFAAVLAEAERLAVECAHAMLAEAAQQFSGADGQPQGDSRRAWLAENRPFAKYTALYAKLGMSGRPAGLIANPNPVGILSGDLLLSLSYHVTSGGSVFTAEALSSAPYAGYLLAWNGTEWMVPRLVSQHMQDWTIIRVHGLGANVMAYQRSLL